MRLIDAGAYRERLQFCHDALPDEAVPSRRQLENDIGMLDAAPAISCEGCEDYGDCSVEDLMRSLAKNSAGRSDVLCCSDFQPRGGEAVSACDLRLSRANYVGKAKAYAEAGNRLIYHDIRAAIDLLRLAQDCLLEAEALELPDAEVKP